MLYLPNIGTALACGFEAGLRPGLRGLKAMPSNACRRGGAQRDDAPLAAISPDGYVAADRLRELHGNVSAHRTAPARLGGAHKTVSAGLRFHVFVLTLCRIKGRSHSALESDDLGVLPSGPV